MRFLYFIVGCYLIVDTFYFFWRKQAHNFNLHAFVRLDFITNFQAVFLSQILC